MKASILFLICLCLYRPVWGRSCEAYYQFLDLKNQQFEIQKQKHRVRTLEKYENDYIFRPSLKYRHSDNAVLQYLRDFIEQAGIPANQNSLENVLLALSRLKNKSIVWADIGAGFALAMRKMAQIKEQTNLPVEMFAVDLWDWQFASPLETQDLAVGASSSLLKPQYKPQWLVADAQTVQFPKSPDLITFIESIQYLDNSLQALVNSYNQLADHGLLIVATEHNWPNRMGRGSLLTEQTPRIFDVFIEQLRKHGITVLTSRYDYRDLESDSSTVLFVKKPNTSLELNLILKRIITNSHQYKMSFYEAPDLDSIVKVRE